MSRKLPGPVANQDLNDLSSPLKLLQTRRSVLSTDMAEPGPSVEQIDQLLKIAVRVPDHGKMCPWRFITFEGEARSKAGDLLGDRWRELHPEHGAETVERRRNLFLRAPLVIGVVSSPNDSPKIPLWEQELSAGALCQNLLLAATAMGFGAQWITGWFSYDQGILEKFNVKPHEKIAGFIFVGTATQEQSDRARPDHTTLVTSWGG